MVIGARSLALMAAVSAFALPAVSLKAQDAAVTQAAQAYDGLAAESLYIPSGDGTRLAITVYRPTRNGAVESEPLPVIVTQNRSEASERTMAEMRRFTDAGYIWIAQDRRGTGASFGVQTGFVNQPDALDALAVIEWAAAQEFSNGRTVAMGCSNQAAWQYLVATLQPASLVAMAPACASPMLFDDAVAIGGVPMIGVSEQPWAGECLDGSTGARPGNFTPPPPQPVDGDENSALLREAQAGQRCGAPMLGQYWLNMPRDGVNAYAGYQPALADTAMTQWEAIRDSGIAVLQIGGWFDAAVPGQIEGQRAFGGRVIMGPWIHGNRPPQGVDFPNQALDLTGETLEFFDLHAKGIEPRTNDPTYLYYTVNADVGEEWRAAESWPQLPRRTLYLTPGQRLSATAPSLAATEVIPPDGARWFDGRYSPLARWFSGDFAQTDAGSLITDSEPLESDIELTGTPIASLWISADQPDANVYAMLQDVAPDGSARYITDGRLRASWRSEHSLPWPGADRTWHRGNAGDLLPLAPGEPTLLRFDFFPISWVLRQGHRLRLTVTSGIGADFDAPPAAEGQPVTLTIHTGPDYPSSLSLPMVAY